MLTNLGLVIILTYIIIIHNFKRLALHTDKFLQKKTIIAPGIFVRESKQNIYIKLDHESSQ